MRMVEETIFQYFQPLIPLILSSMLLFLLIKQSIVRKRFLKGRLIFTFLLVLCCAIILAFFNEISKNTDTKIIIQWCLIGIDVFVGLLYILFSENSSSKEQFNKELLMTLDQSKLYVLLDKKNRIKEISSLFLEDLGISEAEALKKNFFEVIELKYRIFKLNGIDISLKDLNIYFTSPDTKEQTLNLEIHDDYGDVSAYYFDERPIFVFGKFSGRIFVGNKKSSSELIGMEKNLAESTEGLDMIKNRFITLLEETTEGIFFTDLTNQTVWINEVLSKSLRIQSNNLKLQEFMDRIHPDDLAMYKTKLSSVNNIQPKYSTSYRFNIGMRYAYIKESGTRITNGKTVELCGIIRTLDDYNYEKTQTELDVIKGEAEMLATMNQLYKQNRQFQAVLIRLDSIAKINEEYGRAFGNMALSQYIKLIHKNFVDEQMIFRLSGLEFMAIVQDYPKMEKLKNGIVHGEKLLHVDATFGTKKVKIDALMGICDSFDAKDAKDIYSKTKEALRFCSKPQFNASYAYYKDIR